MVITTTPRPGKLVIPMQVDRPRYTYVFLALVAGLALVGCAPDRGGVAYQNSTIDALLDGNYDGDEVTFAELRRHGDFGLGTFDALDGEMVGFDGRFYQVRSDGRAYDVPATATTPFAVVVNFRPDRTLALPGARGKDHLMAAIDALRRGDGHAVAIRIDGTFAHVRTRSVPRQSPPYRRLVDVVKTQPTFDLKNVHGTLVGFWFPESMRHVNVPGYHFHFVTSDRKYGGHVLDVTLTEGTAKLQDLATVTIALPTRDPTTRPATGESNELEKVEK
jgi:acetolactate decarboxylase